MREERDPPSLPISLELETVRRAANGERSAQAWLARRLLPKVRKVARALARTQPDADDAAQMALIEILRSLHTYRAEAALEHWAGRIAARTTLRYLARERRKADVIVRDAETRLASAPSASPFADALPRSVREYLELLPEAQRTAIMLHHGLGHSLDEVAELTEVSRNTVKGRLRLGTAALRKVVRRDTAIGGATAAERLA